LRMKAVSTAVTAENSPATLSNAIVPTMFRSPQIDRLKQTRTSACQKSVIRVEWQQQLQHHNAF
jgi:hypothetical protein